jgi:hypothetical protein
MTNRCRKTCLVAVASMLVFSLFMPLAYYRQGAKPIDPIAVYDAIRIGEPAPHAVSLFHLPPGDYRTNSSVMYLESHPDRAIIIHHPSWQQLSWQFDQCEVLVYVNEDGMIAAKEWRAGVAVDRPFWVVIKDYYRH